MFWGADRTIILKRTISSGYRSGDCGKVEEYFVGEGAESRCLSRFRKAAMCLRFDPRAERLHFRNRHRAHRRPSPRDGGLANCSQSRPCAVAFFGGRRFQASGRSPRPPNAFSANPLWTRLFINDQPTSIVIADSSMVIVQNALQKSFTLNEYIDRSYRDQIEAAQHPGMRDLLRMIAGTPYTSLADATLVERVALYRNAVGRAGLRAVRAAHEYPRFQFRQLHSDWKQSRSSLGGTFRAGTELSVRSHWQGTTVRVP